MRILTTTFLIISLAVFAACGDRTPSETPSDRGGSPAPQSPPEEVQIPDSLPAETAPDAAPVPSETVLLDVRGMT